MLRWRFPDSPAEVLMRFLRRLVFPLLLATGETEMAVAAACTRAARFIFDATRSPATPLDVLDGLLAQKVRAPMSDAIGRYVEARRNAAGKTHAEAVAALKR